jgi:hypothetical protein
MFADSMRIIPYPEVTTVDIERILTRKTSFVPGTRAHPQCVDGAAIRKIVSVQDDRLDKDVSSASSGMDATDHREVLRGSSLGTVPILLRDRLSFSAALIPCLQLWHLH